MIVRARAPLRLGFGGGGSDVSPYSDRFGGYVLNATIDKYAYAVLESDDHSVRLRAADQCQSWDGPAEAHLALDGTLNLHKGVYNRIVSDFNGGHPLPLRLTTLTDAPPGSGLGSSSTLVVAMLTAFVDYLNLPLADYDIAHLAYEIERKDVRLAGGKQDQYAATFGGVNFMEFYASNRVVVNPLRIKSWVISELEASLVLFYTGVSRSSAEIIDEQTRNVSAATQTVALDAMHRVKAEAVHMKESLLRGDLRSFVNAMRDSWEHKKQTANSITNPNIEAIYARAMAAGAKAGKVSGAGGGGFIMFYVEPEMRMDVIRALEDAQGQVFNCHFTKHGAQAWRIF